jgi:hypothetical protein
VIDRIRVWIFDPTLDEEDLKTVQETFAQQFPDLAQFAHQICYEYQEGKQ